MISSSLVLNPASRRQVEAFLAEPSHALLLSGPVGSGKQTVITELGEALLALESGRLKAHPYVKWVETEKGEKSISIDAVREIEHFLSLKVPQSAQIHRLVIIEDAHTMTISAQNALLKTLEEPPSGTIILLTAANPQALLPTIRSRCQAIVLAIPDKASMTSHFSKQGHSLTLINQVYVKSGGLIGLSQAMLSDSEHQLMAATVKAREILKATAFERLLLVDDLVKHKELCLDTLFIIQQMAHIALQTADSMSSPSWQKILTAAYETTNAIQSNGQPKLALTNMMVQIS